ncbi:glycosyltransferase family 4 protein [Arcobacter lacus]|uniref:glycosyltransferase family 4 protein n=1 Tax=Arcobacter lacus TaxID=1912876 RepID=UPI0021BAEAD4|nr:glycosyltransferase family 4 protein [Arcobacter lacus]MCG3714139.1 glycosyltransferase family 4 protein [Aliarcobacter butzleri]MCT7908119.1 glycosyltransferase family 4 protein [Arcobacter lacus]
MKTKITHLTSVHARYDTRIFIKMCTSLALNKDYTVNLVVADGIGEEIKNNVKIYDVGKRKSKRISRMTTTVKKIYNKSILLDSDIYHFHDPELIPVGLKLKKLGKIVIFDSHEDVEKDILSKEWIPMLIRKLISFFYAKYERLACKKFDYIITSTPYIRDKFLKINKNSIDINNFPILNELTNDSLWSEKKNEIFYVGAITKVRGIKELINAMEYLPNIKLNLAGVFNDEILQNEVKAYEGWKNVNELGFLNRSEIQEIMNRSKIGIVTLHPIINHLDSLPVKMFEYMIGGLPVIASDIKLWKDIIEKNNCGICVNPLKPQEIAQAINYLISNPKMAEEMGKNGKKAVLNNYNWDVEEKKLINTYNTVIKQKGYV